MVFTKDYILAFEQQQEKIRELVEEWGSDRARQKLHGELDATNLYLHKQYPPGPYRYSVADVA